LTGASAATYVGNKAALKTGPRISAVNPPTPASGSQMDILGVNLVPAGADPATVSAQTSVIMTDTAAGGASFVLSPAPGTAVSPTKVSVIVPGALTTKTADIQVITTAGVATSPFRVSVK
jgi:hypothetical protein